MDDRHFTAQYGQDKQLLKLCDNAKNGVFIEVGGWTGYTLSNTYYLEKMLDWTGFLVEPIPSKADSAKATRWCPVYKGCVWDRNGDIEFNHVSGYSEMVSHVKDSLSGKYLERVNNEIKEHNLNVDCVKSKCSTLENLMNMFNVSRVDYLSLDMQTSEHVALNSHNFKTYPIKVISIDFNGNDTLSQWFKDNGYTLAWKHEYSDEHMYINRDLKWSWELN